MDESINVDVHPLAATEIDEADDWYSNVNPNVAERFRETVYTALKRIGEQPLAFPVGDAHASTLRSTRFSIRHSFR